VTPYLLITKRYNCLGALHIHSHCSTIIVRFYL